MPTLVFIIPYVVATLFSLFGLVCVLSVAVGLPGTWLLLLVAVLIELSDPLWLPAGDRSTFSWWTLGAVFLIAVLGEVLESAASAIGAKYGGASRRGMIGSLVGALIGGIAGTILILIPVVGSVVGAVLGAAVGASLGEMTVDGTRLGSTMRPAGGAAIGRLLGTLGKLPCAAAVWVVLAVAAFVV